MMRHSEQAAPAGLAQRVQRLEDRNAISERTVKYALAIDRADWALYAACFTDPVHIDFSDAGMPARDFDRREFVEFSKHALQGFKARQHLSPNHVIEFDEADPDRAVCHSYMYAQHYLPGAPGGDFYLMRGYYTSQMLRTAEGWRIQRLKQEISWPDGNTDLPLHAAANAKTNAREPAR